MTFSTSSLLKLRNRKLQFLQDGDARRDVTFAVVRSAKHDMTALAVPAKLFIVDLTICVDVSPNPGPDGFQN